MDYLEMLKNGKMLTESIESIKQHLIETKINFPQVNDIIIYRESDATLLGEVMEADIMSDYINVKDLKVLDNRSGTDIMLFAEWAMHADNIIKNFGNISLEEFEENYPEWII